MKSKNFVTRESVLGLIVVVFMIFLSITTNFDSRNGVFSLMLDISPIMIGSIALSLVIVTGNIDISAGTIMGFVAFVAGYLSKAGVPFYIYITLAILTGGLLAFLNGAITVYFKIPSLVVTLAMNMVHLGFYATFLPNSGWVENLSASFTWFGRGSFFNIIPYIFVVAVIITAFMIFIMRYTRFGKSLYAVGGNRQAAIYSGINPDTTVLKMFVVEGLLLGVAGILKATTNNEIMPSTFQGREMVFIASAVVGGMNIMGGSGKLLGSTFGAFLVYLLSITMIYLGFQDYYQFALQGVVILIAVYITVTDFNKMKQSIDRKIKKLGIREAK
ncbi:MAG: ABC transporter permease [Sphaerochaetaceae bacterium]